MCPISCGQVQAYTRARELWQQVEGTPQQLSAILRGLWLFYLLQGELQMAHETAEQLLTATQRAPNPESLGKAYHAMGATLFFLGDFASACAHSSQGAVIYGPEQKRSQTARYGEDPGMVCLCYTAWDLWMLGYSDQAWAKIREALLLAQNLSHPDNLAASSMLAARFHQLRREARITQEHAETSITLATQHGFTFFLGYSTMMRGWVSPHKAMEQRELNNCTMAIPSSRAQEQRCSDYTITL